MQVAAVVIAHEGIVCFLAAVSSKAKAENLVARCAKGLLSAPTHKQHLVSDRNHCNYI